jgi:hypothetical protein
MTEQEWLCCTDPRPMLESLRGTASARKLRLFTCACCRRIDADFLSGVYEDAVAPRGAWEEALQTAERFADGRATDEELRAAWVLAARVVAAESWQSDRAAAAAGAVALAVGLQPSPGAAPARHAALSRAVAAAAEAAGETVSARAPGTDAASARAALADLARDIFGTAFGTPPALPRPWLTWQDGLVPRLAQAAYDKRQLPSGRLDNARLAVLADALEEAGCADAAILGHLRSGGEHVRGCFVVDAVLAKT